MHFQHLKRLNSLTQPLHPGRDKAAMKLRHWPLSWALACGSLHFRPISSQLFHYRSPPGCFWPASLYFLFPVGVHASCGFFKYPFVRHPQRDMAKPSEPAVLNLERRIHTVRLLIHFLISHLVGPSQWILQILRWQLCYERHLPLSYLLSLLSSTQNHTKRKTKCLNSDIRIINPNKFFLKKIIKCWDLRKIVS